MRRNARHQRSKTRSIQSSVQIILTVTGILFLLAGLVLAASGASVSSAVGAVSDRVDDSQQPAQDDGDTSDGDETGGDNGGNETDGTDSDGDRTGETNTSDGEESAGNDTENDTGDDSHVLTSIVETESGDPIDNATVTVEGGDTTSREKPVAGNGEAEFELEDGQYTVTATADGYNSTENTVEIDGSDTAVTLTLENRDSADNGTDGDGGPYTLAVTVVNQTGDPIDNATVELKEDALFASSEEKDVDDDGQTEFERDDGEYTITADADGYEATRRSVEIDGSDEAITLTLAASDE